MPSPTFCAVAAFAVVLVALAFMSIHAAAAALPVHFARLERVAATLAALTFAVAVMIDKVR